MTLPSYTRINWSAKLAPEDVKTLWIGPPPNRARIASLRITLATATPFPYMFSVCRVSLITSTRRIRHPAYRSD